MDCYNYYRSGANSYLAHHGIKGQKWGVRRYQNEDGSLTDEGKKRYGDYSEKIGKSISKANRLETKAANARTNLGREWNAMRAVSARLKAERKADKAEGKSKWSSGNSYLNKILRVDEKEQLHAQNAETRASIAKKMKERAEKIPGRDAVRGV